MDGSANGLGKLLPKAIAAKRRRRKDTSSSNTSTITEETSSVDEWEQRGRTVSRANTKTSNSTDNANEEDENTDLVYYDSEPES
jgi:hypothetical protein